MVEIAPTQVTRTDSHQTTLGGHSSSGTKTNDRRLPSALRLVVALARKMARMPSRRITEKSSLLTFVRAAGPSGLRVRATVLRATGTTYRGDLSGGQDSELPVATTHSDPTSLLLLRAATGSPSLCLKAFLDQAARPLHSTAGTHSASMVSGLRSRTQASAGRTLLVVSLGTILTETHFLPVAGSLQPESKTGTLEGRNSLSLHSQTEGPCHPYPL